MEEKRSKPTGAPSTCGNRRVWLLPLLGVIVWHVWMTLNLFGSSDPRAALLDERPLTTGSHPLHLYHGVMGARSFLQQGSLSCYDPAFQAGYPKTPVFDGGSRPAELFLALSGGHYQPSSYKIGLMVCCLLVPLALMLAARGAGVTRRGALLAVVLGLLVWWGKPCQQTLAEGDLDLLLAGLAALVQAGLLIRFDRRPRPTDWLLIVLAGFLGWFAHPLLFTLMMPLFLIYYLGVGARHHPLWSLLLIGGLVVALVSNLFWLADWVRFWWLRSPLSVCEARLPHRTPVTLWNASIWGEPVDRAVGVALLVLSLVGVATLNEGGRRTAARLFGLAVLVLLSLTVGGLLSDSLGRLHSPGLLVPGLLLATPLAAHGLEQLWRGSIWLTGRTWRATLLVPLVLTGVGFLARTDLQSLVERAQHCQPLTLGLPPLATEVVAQIEQHTTQEARILWEDRLGEDATPWATLLPLLSDRDFMGGLDPEGRIEHSANGLSAGQLACRPLAEWTDAELFAYCQRFNVGWIICWSRATSQRFRACSFAQKTATFSDGGSLFTLQRQRSFILHGQAKWIQASVNSIVLEDLRPENGKVLLSLHYQAGLRVTPSRVRIEPEIDPSDPIPMIRLLLDAPAARVTLSWEP